MKVLVASMTAESNMLNPDQEQLDEFEIFYGQDMIERMYSQDLFEEAGIKLIPTIYASGGARGYVAKDAFEFILDKILSGVREHKDELDGIFMFLHGASHVVDLEGDAAEHFLLERVREIVGPELPIALCMDPHGNVSQRLTELVNIVRCFRESPHIDRMESHRTVAKMLIDLLKRPREIHPVYVRVPILIGGERCVSAEEPLCSINRKLDQCEKIPGILSASYHVGFAWADSPLCCAAVTVVPEDERYRELAGRKARELADYVFARREDFHFTGNAQAPEVALQLAFETERKPVFMTDSGDNTTAGALGYNTYMLRQFLEQEDYNGKKVLICTIHDRAAVKKLMEYGVGDSVEIDVGVGIDENCRPVKLKGTVKAKGPLHTFYAFPRKIGDTVTVSVEGKALDVTVADQPTAFREIQQFEAAGLEYKNYDIIVVKQGYLYTEEERLAGLTIMSLTPGMTYQYTERLPYRTIFRPMYPIDKSFY